MYMLQRIKALIIRHLIPTFRDPIRICDMLYWPFVDIVLIGFIGVWAQEGVAQSTTFTASLVASVAFWYLMQRAALEISRNFLVEIWEHNLTNILASPFSLSEIFTAFMAIGFIQAIITFIYSLLIIYFIFGQNLFIAVPQLLPTIPLFITSGYIIGLFTSSLIFYFGKTADALAWTMPFLFAILSGVYYPLRFFPVWIQKISYCLPATYLFDAVRSVIIENKLPFNNILISLILCIIYLFLTFSLLSVAYKYAKKRGLGALN